MAIIAYIQADRPSAARHFKARAIKDLERLVEFPDSGRVVPEYPRLGFREVLVGSYRIFYRVKTSTVWVVGVWHDAQIPDVPQEQSGL